VAILLRVEAEGQPSHDYWVAMRSPYDYLESASLVTWGEVAAPPAVSMQALSLKGARDRKS